MNPSGYFGTGYGYSIARLPVSTPQHPIAPQPIPLGGEAVAAGTAPPESFPGMVEGAPMPTQTSWWHQLGHPLYWFGATAPLGVLGFRQHHNGRIA